MSQEHKASTWQRARTGNGVHVTPEPVLLTTKLINFDPQIFTLHLLCSKTLLFKNIIFCSVTVDVQYYYILVSGV